MSLPDLTHLASLREVRLNHSPHRADRPVRVTLASGIHLAAPGPQALADAFLLPWLRANGREILRPASGSGLLERRVGSEEPPRPVDLHALARDLGEALAALPADVPGADRPYRDARHMATEAEPATRDAYLVATVRAARGLVPIWRAPKEQKPRKPGRSATQRQRDLRERERANEAASTRRFLRLYMTKVAPAPGTKVSASWLYAEAVRVLEQRQGDIFDENGVEHVFTPPRRRVFGQVAAEFLGEPRRAGANGSRVYVVPQPVPSPAERLVEIRRAAAATGGVLILTPSTRAEGAA